MTEQAPFGPQQLITELLRGLAEAVGDRLGEAGAQRIVRHQTAAYSAMAFMPRDAVETMLANQCVIFDQLLRDGTQDLLRGLTEPVKRRVRSQLTAIGRAFLKHLDQLRRLQSRPVEELPLSRTAKDEGTTSAEPGPEAMAPEAMRSETTRPAQPVGAAAAPAGSGVLQPRAADVSSKTSKSALLAQRIQNRRERRAMQRKGGSPAG
jgi:hypothetical protein